MSLARGRRRRFLLRNRKEMDGDGVRENHPYCGILCYNIDIDYVFPHPRLVLAYLPRVALASPSAPCAGVGVWEGERLGGRCG